MIDNGGLGETLSNITEVDKSYSLSLENSICISGDAMVRLSKSYKKMKLVERTVVR